VLTIVNAFALPPTRFHVWMVGLLALSVGLVFFLIIAMDRPFAGRESISPEPFEVALRNMKRWDSDITRPEGADIAADAPGSESAAPRPEPNATPARRKPRLR
jgi:hypothetical protein